ncbi:MAG: hypothetical protein ACUVTB_04060 [Candidatus Bathycorpusculaceae bacterium]
MHQRKGRKLILIRSDLLEKIAQITAKEGKTMYSFTNEVFEQVLKAYEMNVNISDIIEFYKLMRIERETGSVIVPLCVLEYVMDKFCKENKKVLLEKWCEAGLWYGKYISSRFSEEESLNIIEKLMKISLRNLINCSVFQKNGRVKIRAMSPHFSLEQTESISKFIEGIFHSLDYVTSKNELLKGMILLEFKKNT